MSVKVLMTKFLPGFCTGEADPQETKLCPSIERPGAPGDRQGSKRQVVVDGMLKSSSLGWVVDGRETINAGRSPSGPCISTVFLVRKGFP
jgi:hypothetical protein